MIKKFIFIFLIIITALLAFLLLYFNYLYFSNSQINIKSKYLNIKDIEFSSFKKEKIMYEGHILNEIVVIYNNNKFEAYVRDVNKPEHVIILFTGRKTGKEAIKYLAPVFLENTIIIAMDYPFEKKNYTILEGITMFNKGRRGILDLTIVAKAIISKILNGRNISSIPIYSVGLSFGSPFSYMLAAIDERIKGIIFIQGFCKIKEMLIMHLRYNFENLLLRKFTGFLFDIAFYPMEPLRWVEYNKFKPSLFIKASYDENVPNEFINPLIEAHFTKKVIVIDGKHLKTEDTESLRQISKVVVNWIN